VPETVDRSVDEPSLTFQERGFPHEATRVAGSRSAGRVIADGDVVARSYFGQDLVLYRAAPVDAARASR
jgi:hypothetical protein